MFNTKKLKKIIQKINYLIYEVKKLSDIKSHETICEFFKSNKATGVVFVGNKKYVFSEGSSLLSDKQEQISKIEFVWDGFGEPSITVIADYCTFKK